MDRAKNRRSTENQDRVFLLCTVLYSTLCVVCGPPTTKNRSFFSSNVIGSETDHSSPIDESTTDKDDRPMNHDVFGGGESIGARAAVFRDRCKVLCCTLFSNIRKILRIFTNLRKILRMLLIGVNPCRKTS